MFLMRSTDRSSVSLPLTDMDGDGVPELLWMSQSGGGIVNLNKKVSKNLGLAAMAPTASPLAYTSSASTRVHPVLFDLNGGK
jgi:hypothetical protein